MKRGVANLDGQKCAENAFTKSSLWLMDVDMIYGSYHGQILDEYAEPLDLE